MPGYVAMGGQAEQIQTGLAERYRPGLSLSEALRPRRRAAGARPGRRHAARARRRQLEVAVLDRLRPRRAFRRLAGSLLERLLLARRPHHRRPHTDDPRPGRHETLTGDDGPGDEHVERGERTPARRAAGGGLTPATFHHTHCDVQA